MKRAVLPALSLVLFTSCLFTSCRPSSDRADGGSAAAQSARTVSAEFVETPKLGEVGVRVTVLEDGEAVNDAQVNVTGDMTHAGMAPVEAEAEPQGDGTYLTKGFAFNMAGDWILTVEAVYPDGNKVTKNLAAAVPAG